MYLGDIFAAISALAQAFPSRASVISGACAGCVPHLTPRAAVLRCAISLTSIHTFTMDVFAYDSARLSLSPAPALLRAFVERADGARVTWARTDDEGQRWARALVQLRAMTKCNPWAMNGARALWWRALIAARLFGSAPIQRARSPLGKRAATLVLRSYAQSHGEGRRGVRMR